MGLKNCPECGKLYIENATGMCPVCYAQVEQDEVKVVEYLREVKKASLQQVHEATGVKESIIMRMLKRGRIVNDFIITYPCETCGTLISEGRLCAKCNKNIMEQMQPEAKPWQPSEIKESRRGNERMYTSDISKYKK